MDWIRCRQLLIKGHTFLKCPTSNDWQRWKEKDSPTSGQCRTALLGHVTPRIPHRIDQGCLLSLHCSSTSPSTQSSFFFSPISASLMSILQTKLHLSLLPRELRLGHLVPSGPRKCVLKWNFGASPKYFHYLEMGFISHLGRRVPSIKEHRQLQA